MINVFGWAPLIIQAQLQNALKPPKGPKASDKRHMAWSWGSGLLGRGTGQPAWDDNGAQGVAVAVRV